MGPADEYLQRQRAAVRRGQPGPRQDLTDAAMDLEFMFDSEEARLAAKVALLLGALLLLLRLLDLRRWVPVYRGTRSIPLAPGCLPLFGHALSLAQGCSWGQMYDWLAEKGPIVKFRVGVRQGILVADPASMKRIVQTRQRVYTKDTDFSYKEFLSILGTGLVTANGKHWQNQRILMAPAFRIDMLDAILPIAARAVERLAVKLRAIKGTEQTGAIGFPVFFLGGGRGEGG